MPNPRKAPKPKQTPAPADEATISEELREGQKAYLLLQLLDAENHTLTKGEANKFKDLRKADKTALNLTKAAVANYRRERLADMKLLEITPGRTVHYTLLADGREYLATCTRHLRNAKVAIQGKTLNALIAAAQDSSFRIGQRAAHAPTDRPTPLPGQLADTVLAIFAEFRRERHSRSGLVPIHEVRQRIAEQFGPTAARHDVLDEAILGLWRDKRIGLEGISDLGSATEQQLNDSIPGEGNTIFYLEVPREQPIAAEPVPG
jgi:hypothetical protein